MMELKESNHPNNEFDNDNHTESDVCHEIEQDPDDGKTPKEFLGSKKYRPDALIGDSEGLRGLNQGQFRQEFIKPTYNQGWGMPLPKIFENQLNEVFPSFPPRNVRSSASEVGFHKIGDSGLKFCKAQVDKKSKNIFFKTTKKNLYQEPKASKVVQLSVKGENSSRFMSSVSLPEDHQSASKKPKFKENNIDLLLTASELLIKNGVLDDIEEKIRIELKNGSSLLEKERAFIDVVEGESSHSNSNSSTKFHNNKKKHDIHKRKCQNKACESQLKKVMKVDNPVLHKKLGINYLCKLCVDSYKQNKYCIYCYSIYHSNSDDKKSWIQCDYCPAWNHVQCEENKGTYKNIMRNNIKGGLKYRCPKCKDKPSISKPKTKSNSATNSSQKQRPSITNNFDTGLSGKLKLIADYFRNTKKNSALFDEKLPMSNHLYLLSSNDNREIYHDLMKIKNSNELF